MTNDLESILHVSQKLRSLPESLYKDRHDNVCQHPYGLFIRSLSKILDRMVSLVYSIESNRLIGGAFKDFKPVADATESLLFAMESYRDNLTTIIWSISLKSEKNKKKISDDLRNQFEELVSRPLNQVKHHGCTIQSKSCFNSQYSIVGYFICGVRDDGVMGTSAQAHGNSGIGWSFNVALRRLLGIIIRTAKIIDAELPADQRSALPSWGEDEYQNLSVICGWIESQPRYCFPNEYPLPIPDVTADGSVGIVNVGTIKKLRDVTKIRPITWSVSYTGDGVNRKFSIF